MQYIDFIKQDLIRHLEGVTSDSRRVHSGFLFAALPGSKSDGTQYIGDAITHGAKYILHHSKADIAPYQIEDVVFIETDNTRKAFSEIAAKFYKLQPSHIVAVTGTSGKTSTVSFIQQLWHLSGITKCASLGTLGLRGPGMIKYGRLTTPDSEELHAELADLAAVGINHLAMEASSHGLDQFRLDGVHIKAAAYTNLSRDHLDYHRDMEQYFLAKARLFDSVMAEGSVAVINADDSYADKLEEICKKRHHKIISFGRKGRDITLKSLTPKPHGQEISFVFHGKTYHVMLPLVGEFQAMNALCALALVSAFDAEGEKFIPLLEKLRGVSGRLQLVHGHPKGAVYIDYAHKPAALETVLQTLRPHTEGKLVVVFGCGGNRDPGKRPIMGEIASALADAVIITDDNPRYEEADMIRAEILAKAPGAVEIGDRREAIAHAIKTLSQGDVLVIAGKGHETGQIIGENILPFNDLEEAQKAIEKVKS